MVRSLMPDIPDDAMRCLICHEPIAAMPNPFYSETDDGEPVAACRACIVEALAETYGTFLDE